MMQQKNDKEAKNIVVTMTQQTRRQFLRKAAYASPVLLTLPAAPSIAQQGSAAGAGGDMGGDMEPPVMGGPQPADQANCEMPMEPIDNEFALSVCDLTTDPNTGQLLGQDLIVNRDALPEVLERGGVFGTCDNFFCGAS